MRKAMTSSRSHRGLTGTLGLTAVASLAAAGAVAGTGVTGAGATPPAYTWPVFHNTSDLQGTSADPGISTANAATLGVRWMRPIGGGISSPVVAYNADLGQTLVYAGTLAGYIDAVNADTGQLVWSDYLGKSILSTPIVEGDNVWVVPTKGATMYKLNAATGATECTAAVKGSAGIQGTPVFATPPGGSPTVYLAGVGGATGHAPVWAVNEATCALQAGFSFTSYKGASNGSWSPMSYAVNAKGVPMILWGSENDDDAVYAANAVTGKLVWRFQTVETATDQDVGAGVTTSAPGVNGFADGVAYVVGKDGHAYAVDLTTGAQIWDWNFGASLTVSNADTTPALSGTNLVFSDTGHVYDVNALNGTEIWEHDDGTALINDSAAIVGPAGQQVVAYDNWNGVFHVLSLSNPTMSNPGIYSYKTGGNIDASPADYNGNLYIVSTDGFLYDFAPGGGNGSTPTTTVGSPANGATVPYPGTMLTITGTASAPDGVSSVLVTVDKNKTSSTPGRYFNQATQTFVAGQAIDTAVLGSPGANSTTWSLSIPVGKVGASFVVSAYAVGSNGVVDLSGQAASAAQSSFTVSPAV
jgi:outer membrane protein assembly factor BamB